MQLLCDTEVMIGMVDTTNKLIIILKCKINVLIHVRTVYMDMYMYMYCTWCMYIVHLQINTM